MKNILLGFFIGIVFSIGSSFAYNSYQEFNNTSTNKEVLALLSNIHSAAIASQAEYGNYPKSFEGIGFALPTKSNVILKYCSTGESFKAGALHKTTGYSATIASNGEKGEGLSMVENCEGELWGI